MENQKSALDALFEQLLGELGDIGFVVDEEEDVLVYVITIRRSDEGNPRLHRPPVGQHKELLN